MEATVIDGHGDQLAVDDGGAVEEGVPVEMAGAWPRFVARLIDNVMWSYAVVFIAAMIFPAAMVEAGESRAGSLLVGFVALPFAFLIDAVVLSMTGRSIGKLVVGLKLVDMNMQKLSVPRAIERNMRAWIFGMFAGLPLLNLAGLANAYNDVQDTKVTKWDESSDSRVVNAGYHVARAIAGGLLALALYIGDRVLMMMGQ